MYRAKALKLYVAMPIIFGVNPVWSTILIALRHQSARIKANAKIKLTLILIFQKIRIFIRQMVHQSIASWTADSSAATVSL